MQGANMTVMEAVTLLVEWAKTHGIGPLQTVTMALGVFGLFALSKFVGRAKEVVGNVHHVYEQALADARKELDNERSRRRTLLAELEAERTIKEDLLRKLATLRAEKAQLGE